MANDYEVIVSVTRAERWSVRADNEKEAAKAIEECEGNITLEQEKLISRDIVEVNKKGGQDARPRVKGNLYPPGD